jgi:predicted transposase YbfD/YdcC
MEKNNRLKQNIQLHEKIVAMENTILDLNVNDLTHEVFRDNSKTIYKCLQNIKGMIYNDEIVFKKGAN